jgi:hypothetical protein
LATTETLCQVAVFDCVWAPTVLVGEGVTTCTADESAPTCIAVVTAGAGSLITDGCSAPPPTTSDSVSHQLYMRASADGTSVVRVNDLAGNPSQSYFGHPLGYEMCWTAGDTDIHDPPPACACAWDALCP